MTVRFQFSSHSLWCVLSNAMLFAFVFNVRIQFIILDIQVFWLKNSILLMGGVQDVKFVY